MIIKLRFILPLILAATSVSNAKPPKDSGNKESGNNIVVFGPLLSISEDGKTLTIMHHHGDAKRQITLTKSSKISYNGILEAKDRQIKVGYSARANLGKDDTIKQLHLSEPFTPEKPLGPNRLKMSPAEIFAAADANNDGKLTYLEFSASIYRSEKHGPQMFPAADGNSDGTLNADELEKHLGKVNWWKWSRKTSDEWFKLGDKNADGRIEISEFSFYYEGHIEQRFPAADKNKNGSLDLNETKDVIKKLISGPE